MIAISGCASVLQTLEDLSNLSPSADVTGVRISSLDMQSVTLEFDVAIGNPYSFDRRKICMCYSQMHHW